MDTQTFWTTVGLIAAALMIIAPLAHSALGGDAQQRTVMHATGFVAALSFTLEAGAAAVAMTLPWLFFGATLALNEVRSIGFLALLRDPNTAVRGSLATWVWMAAGAGWLTAHRLGIEPFGFDRAITLLTVGHFHVAGVGLTALFTLTHRRRPGRALLAAIWLHQAGMLTVAAGLTFNDHLEVIGAVAITVALAVWVAVIVRWIRDELQGAARVLLTIAAVAWIMPMALALGWALGPFLPEPVVTTFSTMLRYHAALQTFGLVVCGLAGVALTDPAHSGAPPTIPLDETTTEAHDDVAHQTHA